MRTLILLLFITLSATAQNSVGFGVYQDAKLALLGDDKGNEPFTHAWNFKFTMEGEQQRYGHWQVAMKTEFAKLKGGDYTRFGFEAGYTFDTPIIKHTPMIGWGFIARPLATQSWELSVEQSYGVTDWLNVIALHYLTQRSDLKQTPWRYNFSIGLQFDIDTDYD